LRSLFEPGPVTSFKLRRPSATGRAIASKCLWLCLLRRK
jgi:hypothetical protein